MTYRDLGYETFEEWSRDLLDRKGAANRDHLHQFRPEYDDVPQELIPWPFRGSDVAEPTYCPKCGRVLIHYWWGGNNIGVGYHELGCAGALQWLMRLRPGWLFLIHHWQIGLGENDRPKRRGWRYDPLTGEPMDGA